MKTWMELLGDDMWVVDPDPNANPFSSGGKPNWERMFELVAERAREEMREAAAKEVEATICCDTVYGTCACYDSGCVDARKTAACIRAIPTHPDHAGKAGAR